jgi:tRNA pseudouridine55 synthase
MTHKTGILLVDKAEKATSFQLVSLLRRITQIKKIGHAGTLDPFATGVMVMLIGQEFTRRSDEFLKNDKKYRATLTLGTTTDTFDKEGQITSQSDLIPSLQSIEEAIAQFQGEVLQTPPMFSAKKIGGKKLYDLARKGITIDREPVKVHLKTQLIKYEYPYLEIEVECSKGTYIRSIGSDLGTLLHSGAHLSSLVRLKSGPFSLEQCISHHLLNNPLFDITPHLRSSYV